MRRLHAAFFVLAAATALSIAHPAASQTKLIPLPRVKIGAFFPTDTTLRNVAGNTWFKVGADIGVPFSLIPLGSARVGIDYVANGSSNIVPITLVQTFQPSVGLSLPVYVGAGIGLWTGHIQGSGTSTEFGLRLVGGSGLGKRLFLEVQYDIVKHLGSARADGFSVLVGTQF